MISKSMMFCWFGVKGRYVGVNKLTCPVLRPLDFYEVEGSHGNCSSCRLHEDHHEHAQQLPCKQKTSKKLRQRHHRLKIPFKWRSSLMVETVYFHYFWWTQKYQPTFLQLNLSHLIHRLHHLHHDSLQIPKRKQTYNDKPIFKSRLPTNNHLLSIHNSESYKTKKTYNKAISIF